jgi:hypothetical protein
MVKMILQYTAQPLVGFNHLQQGAGQLNVEGAIRLAKLVRQDLTDSPALGARRSAADRLNTAASYFDRRRHDLSVVERNDRRFRFAVGNKTDH